MADLEQFNSMYTRNLNIRKGQNFGHANVILNGE